MLTQRTTQCRQLVEELSHLYSLQYGHSGWFKEQGLLHLTINCQTDHKPSEGGIGILEKPESFCYNMTCLIEYI